MNDNIQIESQKMKDLVSAISEQQSIKPIMAYGQTPEQIIEALLAFPECRPGGTRKALQKLVDKAEEHGRGNDEEEMILLRIMALETAERALLMEKYVKLGLRTVELEQEAIKYSDIAEGTASLVAKLLARIQEYEPDFDFEMLSDEEVVEH